MQKKAVIIPAISSQAQKEAFEAAMKQFHERNFSAALPLFEKAAEGPGRDVTHTARQHANICRQRLPAAAAERAPGGDLYHLGLAQVAERRIEEAQRTLDGALAENPEADHVLYALCLCHGLRGDLETARRFLERAIELNPKNRSIARTDADFLEFGRHSPLRELVFGERTHVEKKEI